MGGRRDEGTEGRRLEQQKRKRSSYFHVGEKFAPMFHGMGIDAPAQGLQFPRMTARYVVTCKYGAVLSLILEN